MARSLIRSIVASFNGYGAIRAAKNVRSAAMDHAFRAKGHAERDRFLEEFKPDYQAIVFTIAFNTPWVIDLLTASWAENVSDAILVVADNSSDRSAREAHARICRERGIAYVELPKNWEWNPTRSHGVALNWVYYNLVERLQPEIFGFVDHDCFPTERISIRALLGNRQFCGLVLGTTRVPEIWYLWPGFCFYHFMLTRGRDVDFKHAIEWGGDTGVMNWGAIYSRLDKSLVRSAPSEMVPAPDGAPVSEMQIIDGLFNHVGKASYRADLASSERQRAVSEFLWAKYLPGHRPLVTL